MKRLATLFAALADPARLRILNLLMGVRELCVCDLERTLGFTQTKVSRHMGRLRRAGLVTARRSGRWMIYALRGDLPPSVRRALLGALGDLLAAEEQARNDRALLSRDIREGCCVASQLRTPARTRRAAAGARITTPT